MRTYYEFRRDAAANVDVDDGFYENMQSSALNDNMRAYWALIAQNRRDTIDGLSMTSAATAAGGIELSATCVQDVDTPFIGLTLIVVPPADISGPVTLALQDGVAHPIVTAENVRSASLKGGQRYRITYRPDSTWQLLTTVPAPDRPYLGLYTLAQSFNFTLQTPHIGRSIALPPGASLSTQSITISDALWAEWPTYTTVTVTHLRRLVSSPTSLCGLSLNFPATITLEGPVTGNSPQTLYAVSSGTANTSRLSQLLKISPTRLRYIDLT